MPEPMIGPAVVMYGNPGDGFGVIGHFDDGSEAVEWAETHLKGIEWWVMPLISPVGFDSPGD